MFTPVRSILLGPLFALAVLVAQVFFASLMGFVPLGTRAQGTGAAISTALFLVAGYVMGRLRRGEVQTNGLRTMPWRMVIFASFTVTLLGAWGWWFEGLNGVFPASAIQPGGMARGMLASNAVLIAPLVLMSAGAALGGISQHRAIFYGGGGAFTLLGISIGIREIARYIYLDPNAIGVGATVGVGVSALLVGFGLAWARKQIAFVEMAITALLVGYVIYLTVAIGPPSLVVSWSLPIEQILLALSIVPSIALMAFLAVGGSLGFLLFGSGHFDAGISYEFKVAARYLQVNLPTYSRRTAGLFVVNLGLLISAGIVAYTGIERPFVWWAVVLSTLMVGWSSQLFKWRWGYSVVAYLFIAMGLSVYSEQYDLAWVKSWAFGFGVAQLWMLAARWLRGVVKRWASVAGAQHKMSSRPVFVGAVTVISVLGVAIGVMALIVVLSVMSGFEEDLKSKILGAHAHIIVEKYGDDFTEYKDVEAKVQQVKNVRTASAFVVGDAMITTDDGLAGTRVKGVQSDSEEVVAEIRQDLFRGDVKYLNHPEMIPGACMRTKRPLKLNPKPPPKAVEGSTVSAASLSPTQSASHAVTCSGRILPGILIGRELAHQIGARVGHVVKLVSPVSDEISPMGPIPKLRKFRVAGVFFSGMYEYDAKLVYISMKQAQRFFGKRGRASGVELKISDIDLSSLVVGDIQRRLGGKPYNVRDWRDMNKELFSALLLEKIAMFVALAMIIMVASFLIVATLVIVVLQRGREIAILKSLGASDASIMKVFVIQGVIVGLSGSLLGVGMGVGICLFLERVGFHLDNSVFYIDLLPVVLNWSEVGIIAVSAMIITYLATIYPAMTAAVLKPVEGLRDE